MITGIRAAGPLGLLLELPGLDEVLAVHQHLSAHPLGGQVDAVAAGSTIMLSFTTRPHLRQAREELAELKDLTFESGESREIEIEVVYDGEDLDELAHALGMSREALVSWHSGQTWFGAFGGFAPGFTYCTPQEEAHAVPRRSSPRTAVPEKSVAVAGGFSGVYPRVSPGGWQLIGRTPATMWDLSREHPALVAPGDAVRYVPVAAEKITLSEQTEHDGGRETQASTTGADAPDHAVLRVEEPGMQLLVQDPGRAGHSDLGVSRAGVADEAAARQANRLVGNSEGAAVLEILHGGTILYAERTVVLALTGAELSLTVTAADGSTRHPALRTPFALTRGETLELGMASAGLRGVLAVRGGITGSTELGSLSSDTMSGLGPAPLQAGDTINTAEHRCGPVGHPEPGTLPTPSPDGGTVLRFTYGPRHDWFSDKEQQRLTGQHWRVTNQADRVGIRLEPHPQHPDSRALQRSRTDELPSEGVQRGSLQMPPEGSPVLFLNDHPVTGGYPVIGVVIPQDLPAAAQLRPGDTVHLHAVDPDTLRPRHIDPDTATPKAHP